MALSSTRASGTCSTNTRPAAPPAPTGDTPSAGTWFTGSACRSRWHRTTWALSPRGALWWIGRIPAGSSAGSSGLVAVWTHWKNQGREGSDQSQSIAYSRDRGRTWTKFAGNPVLPNQGVPDFRDPKTFWHAPTGRWVMLVATFDCATFFVSPNLRDWTYLSSFGRGEGATGEGSWECVDLFELPVDGDPDRTKWVLNVSLGSATMQYFVGRFDGTAFHNENAPDVVLRSTCGPDDYAAVTWAGIPPADGRQVWIGWMADFHYAERVPTEGWKGVLTLPRRLALKTTAQGVRLTQTPVTELEGLRGPGQHWEDLGVAAGRPFVLPQKADACEIIADFEIGEADEVAVLVRKGEGEQTVIGYARADRTLFLDRSRSGITDFDAGFGEVKKWPLSLVTACASVFTSSWTARPSKSS